MLQRFYDAVFVFENFNLSRQNVQQLAIGFHYSRPISFQFDQSHELLVLNDARDEKEHDQEKY
jgi:hypothetical protein